MKRTSLKDHPCSIARSLEVVGEWWTPLILRDVSYGLRRFGDLQEDLGISANVLADRLATLVREGVLETRAYQERPERREYALSEKGRELLPALLALMRWGDRWGWEGEAGAPVRVLHQDCGHEVSVGVRCECCARELEAHELVAVPGEPVAHPPRRGEPGHLSGARLYAYPRGVTLNGDSTRPQG
ncbi:MAG: transcriptional regulator [Solirubrobacterales bacterium]|nr:transcriptional regulator [Solirubrobacterales bacterium]